MHAADNLLEVYLGVMSGAGGKCWFCVLCLNFVCASFPVSSGTPDFDKIYKKFEEKCHSNPANHIKNPNIIKCNITFEGSCWPDTPTGMTVVQRCPFLFFRPENNISRRCDKNGRWEEMVSNQCHALNEKEATNAGIQVDNNTHSTGTVMLEKHRYNQLAVYVAFNWVALIVMVPCFILTCVVINRQNDRFNMHKNLILAYILRIVTFFVYHYGDQNNTSTCNVLWVLNRYFAVSEVTWMLIEAIFLLRMLVYPLDNKSYLYYYFFFGWGFSGVLTFCVYLPFVQFVVARKFDTCWINHGDTIYMLVLYIPMTIMLVINLVIMVFVVSTIVRKLKDSRTPQLVTAKKAAKATIVLLPTLGIIYLIIFYIPPGNTAFDYFVRVVYPMQGILVCIFHVLLSSDVQEAVRRQWWKYNHAGDSGPYTLQPDRAEDNRRDGDSQAATYGRTPAGNELSDLFSRGTASLETNTNPSADGTSSTGASQDTPNSSKQSSRATLRSAGQRESKGSLPLRSSDLIKIRAVKVEPEPPKPVRINVGHCDQQRPPDGKPMPSTAAWTEADSALEETTSPNVDPDVNLSGPFGASTGVPNRGFMSHSETDLRSCAILDTKSSRSLVSLRSTNARETRTLPGVHGILDKTETFIREANKVFSSSHQAFVARELNTDIENSDYGESNQENEEFTENGHFKSSSLALFSRQDETLGAVTDQVSEASSFPDPGSSKEQESDLPEGEGGRTAWAKIGAINKERRRSRQRSAVIQPTGIVSHAGVMRKHSDAIKEPEEYKIAWIRKIMGGKTFKDDDESTA